jgi:hypothetical protein
LGRDSVLKSFRSFLAVTPCSFCTKGSPEGSDEVLLGDGSKIPTPTKESRGYGNKTKQKLGDRTLHFVQNR